MRIKRGVSRKDRYRNSDVGEQFGLTEDVATKVERGTLGQGECTDIRGRLISHGLHYIPGPDTCTLCICDNGQPKVCKAVLCSPPQDCRSFRVGNTCCEFICLDDVVKPVEGAEANVRVAAGGAAAVVLLTIALVVYRVRKQKRRRLTADERSITSIGYISGSIGYVTTNSEAGLAAWKPSSNYMPRGEAPPPYDEAIAQSRADVLRYFSVVGLRKRSKGSASWMTNECGFQRNSPALLESLARNDDSRDCPGHAYINIGRPVTQVANNQSSCLNAPLLQTVHGMEAREIPNVVTHHAVPPNVSVGFPSAIRLTGSLGTITNRGLLSLLQREPVPGFERPHNVPGFYTNTGALAMHSSLHRTIPRISTAIDTTILDTAISNFNRTDRSLQNEIRRSFHKPNENNRHCLNDTGRSMPRNLNLASNSEMSRSVEPSLPQIENSNSNIAVNRLKNHNEEQSVEPKPTPKIVKPVVPPPENTPPAQTLPLTIDRPSCVCSYEGEAAPGNEDGDADDYRSECENCKSASSSRWVLEEGWVEEAEDGTQTLQRRAPPPAAPPPATATLPQPVTKQSVFGNQLAQRTNNLYNSPQAAQAGCVTAVSGRKHNGPVVGPPSNWENWFNTIPDSDTESEEE
ncbi:hypothetical protein EVAR_89292_1 [Eumeta japonica]|uniref:Integral membrane protein DGCR2/IDD n=1 Tax=Eumeta variegata TaxID=151549 RepID=A0A4C1YY05_EUMVA|nr:hypothetical protein EVAR_89292_1 [Eumeta japonica]